MPRVLVVEDESVLLLLIKTHLQSLQCKVVGEANDGKEAVELARTLNPDIILMDISMPGEIDGINAAEMILKEQGIPIIFVTSHTDEETINKATSLSPSGYLFKPIKKIELKVAIDIALSRKAVEEKLLESERRYKASEEALRLHQTDLEKMVAEQTADLIKAKDIAEKANHAKGEFLTNMSHELRTPMHQILSYAQLGMSKKLSTPVEKLLDFFGKIADSGQRLMDLLNDLMDLSTLTSGKMLYQMNKFDLTWIIKSMVMDIDQQFKEKEIELIFELPDFQANVMCDNVRIEQVFRNLLSNTMKYTSAGKQVAIRIGQADLVSENGETVPGVTVDVADQGVGIPEDELNSIFEKFSQSTRTKTGAGGTGLGLAICNEIVRQHGGTIVATNNADGGATFRITLPFLQND